MRTVRIIYVMVCAVFLTLALALVQLPALAFGLPIARKVPMWWHRAMLAVIGVKVHVHGEIPDERPVLVVSNHVSWADIMVLGSLFPVCFIAKSEVSKMPGINLLAWFQRTVFVARQKRSDAVAQANTIASRLGKGDAMVLFAEGTTGDGRRVLPFKSALFGAAHIAMEQASLEKVLILPMAIAYTHLMNLPLGRYHQTKAAWPGDIPLNPHLGDFVSSGAYDVQVAVGTPVIMREQDSRKKTTREAEAEVCRQFEIARQGGSCENGSN